MSWKSIYDKASVLMADKDLAEMVIKAELPMHYIVARFDDDEIEALLMEIIHKYKEESK